MIHAYAEEYLDDAMRNLGEAMDYARECHHLDLDTFLSLFIATNLAREFGHGDPRVVSGLSGTELVLETLHRSGLSSKNPPAPQRCYDLSSAYWCGWILAFTQWRSGRSFREIHSLLTIKELERLYPTLHETGEDRAADSIEKILLARQPVTKLQNKRKLCHLTQKELSEKAGLNLRTLQQYETRAKDINHAAGETLLSLSKVLSCRMDDLLEYS